MRGYDTEDSLRFEKREYRKYANRGRSGSRSGKNLMLQGSGARAALNDVSFLLILHKKIGTGAQFIVQK
jgi:hypothetical protein